MLLVLPRMRGHLNRMDSRTSINFLWTLSRAMNRPWWRHWRSINLLRLCHRSQRPSGHNIGLNKPLPIYLNILLWYIFVILLMLSSHPHRRHKCTVSLILWIASLCHGRRIIHVLDLAKSWWLSIVWLFPTYSGCKVCRIFIQWCCSRWLIWFATKEEENS